MQHRRWLRTVLLVLVVMIVSVGAGSAWAEGGDEPTPTPAPTGTPTPTPTPVPGDKGKSRLEQAKETAEFIVKVVEFLTGRTVPGAGPVLDLAKLVRNTGETGVGMLKIWETERLYPDFEDQSQPLNRFRLISDIFVGLAALGLFIYVIYAIVAWAFFNRSLGDILSFGVTLVVIDLFTAASTAWLSAPGLIATWVAESVRGDVAQQMGRDSYWEILLSLVMHLANTNPLLLAGLFLLIYVLSLATFLVIIWRYLNLWVTGTFLGAGSIAGLVRKRNPEVAKKLTFKFLSIALAIGLMALLLPLMGPALLQADIVGYAALTIPAWLLTVLVTSSSLPKLIFSEDGVRETAKLSRSSQAKEEPTSLTELDEIDRERASHRL